MAAHAKGLHNMPAGMTNFGFIQPQWGKQDVAR